MKIAIAKETDPSEPRVAGTAETVKKFKALGAEVSVERGAGIASGILDADYEAAESCQVSIIHPGKPRNPNEPGLDELLKRAEPFI